MKSYCILFVILLLTSCGSSNSDSNQIIIQNERTQDEFKSNLTYDINTKMVGLISKYDGDPFLDTIMNVAESILTESGIYTVYKAPYSYSNTIDNQIRILDEFILSNMDGIVIIPSHKTKLNDSIVNACLLGIPIVIVDTPIDIEDLEAKGADMSLIHFIQIDNYQAAYEAANTFFKKSEEGWEVLLLDGDMNHTNAIQRRNGFIDAIEENGHHLQHQMDCLWQEHIAYKKVKAYLADNNVNMIMCANDRMAMGAIIAIKELGMSNQIIVTGFDGNEDAIEAVNNDELGFTVRQIPQIFGLKAGDILINILMGEDVDTYYYLDTEIIMKDMETIDEVN